MNIQEIISSGILESYVAGTTSAEETALVNKLAVQHPEVLREIEAIEAALIHYSSGNAKPLSTSFRENLALELQIGVKNEIKTQPDVKVIHLKKKLSLYRISIAATLILFIMSIAYNVSLHQKIKEVNDELADLQSEKNYIASELNIEKVALKEANNKINIALDPNVKSIILIGMNSLQNKSAQVLWNTKTTEVYFRALTLPEVSSDKAYQLWAIIDGKPVDAGMLTAKDSTEVFQKMKTITNAQAFAVTIEKTGGNLTPTMETLCLMGKI